MRVSVTFPPQLADEHTLIAQRYAGYFVGHPYRAAQQRVGPDAIRVDWTRAWTEPAVLSDDCAFCRRMTDADVERRVAGYQHAIDIEVLRPHSLAYAEWLGTASDGLEDVTVEDGTKKRGVNASQANRRRFIELHLERLNVRPAPMVGLPLRLKRKLCIEWNHLYRDWLRENPEVAYDFEAHEFYREAPDAEAQADEPAKDWWNAYVPGAQTRSAR